MTIEQLQKENAALKQDIIDIYKNSEECIFNDSSTAYAVEQDYVNDAYDLTQPES